MFAKLWRWLIGTKAVPCAIEIEMDGQRIRYEAPTVDEVRELAGAVKMSHSEYVEQP